MIKSGKIKNMAPPPKKAIKSMADLYSDVDKPKDLDYSIYSDK